MKKITFPETRISKNQINNKSLPTCRYKNIISHTHIYICIVYKTVYSHGAHRKLSLSIPNTRYSTKPRINEKPRTSAGDIGILAILA